LRPDYNFDYLERLTWLVSLDFFLEKINNIDIEENIKNNIHDILTAYLKEPVRYLALNVFRRFN
jgi:hypothetical protein